MQPKLWDDQVKFFKVCREAGRRSSPIFGNSTVLFPGILTLRTLPDCSDFAKLSC